MDHKILDLPLNGPDPLNVAKFLGVQSTTVAEYYVGYAASNGDLLDLSGNSRTLAASGSPLIIDTFMTGRDNNRIRCASLNGSSQFFSRSHEAWMNLFGSNFSLSFVLQSSAATNRFFFSHGISGASGSGIACMMDSSGIYRAYLYKANASVNTYFNSNESDGFFHIYHVVRSGTSLLCYFEGVAGTSVDPSTYGVDGTQPLYFGCGPSNVWQAGIIYARIQTSVLTATQVQRETAYWKGILGGGAKSMSLPSFVRGQSSRAERLSGAISMPTASDTWPVTNLDGTGTLFQSSMAQELKRTNEFGTSPWTSINVTESDITPKYPGVRMWFGVASDSDGSNLIIASHTGNIYTSSDSGATWVKRTSAGIGKWSAVASDSDGSTLIACQGNWSTAHPGCIYTSSDSGATWTIRNVSNPKIYTDVASDSTGQYLVACAYGTASAIVNGYIYTSNDYGVNWTQRATANGWQGVTSSANGQYLAACIGGNGNGYIYTSSNYGVTWTSQTNSGSRMWRGIASDSTGQYLVACVGMGTNPYGYIYTSTDYGVNWTERASAGSQKWSGVASDSTGSILLACAYEGKAVYRSTDGGANWSICSGPGDAYWTCVASDSDGSHLLCGMGNKTSGSGGLNVSGHVFLSTDSGVNWSMVADPGDPYYYSGCYNCKMSSDGSKLFLGNYFSAYVSNDMGVTWSDVGRLAYKTGSGYPSLSLSSNGTYLSYLDSNILYFSKNGGGSFSSRTGIPAATWMNIQCDGTGQYLVGGADWGYLYRSTDYGVTWSQTNSIGSARWFHAAGDSDGSNWIASDYNGYVYTSTDYGSNWTQRTGPQYGAHRGVATDADGSNLITCRDNYGSGGYVYTSSNAGANWTQRLTARQWYGVASDSTGSKLYACDYFGFIQTSTDGGANWTERRDLGAGRFVSITCDATGSNVFAVEHDGVMWKSSDSGVTWTPVHLYDQGNACLYWTAVASSSDGSFLVIAGPGTYIYKSTNGGTTWTECTAGGARYWKHLDVDSDGSCIIAAVNDGYIYLSTDSGSTWVPQTAAGSRAWSSVSIDSTGTTLAACVFTGSGYIYTSPDGGVNWYERTGPGSKLWQDIDMNDTGQYMVASASSSNLYVSTDYGATWTARGTSLSYDAVACSSTGATMYAWDSAQGGYVYRSTNYGTSWSQTQQLGYTWKKMCCNGAGTYVFFGNNRNPIVSSIDSCVGLLSWYNIGLLYTNAIACNSAGSRVFVCGAPAYNNSFPTFVFSYALAIADLSAAVSTRLAPDNTTYYYKLTSSSNNVIHSFCSSPSISDLPYSFEVDAQPGNKDWLYLAITSKDAYAYYNVRNRVIGNTRNCTASIKNFSGRCRCGIHLMHWNSPPLVEMSPADSNGVRSFAGDGVTPDLYVWEASAHRNSFQMLPVTRSDTATSRAYDLLTYPIDFFPGYTLGGTYHYKYLTIEVKVRCLYASGDDIGESIKRGIVCIGNNSGTAQPTQNNVIIYGFNEYIYASFYNDSGTTERYMRHVVTDANVWHVYRLKLNFSNLALSTFTKDGVLHTSSANLTGSHTLNVADCLLRIAQSYVSSGSSYQVTGNCEIAYVKIWVGN